MRYRDRLVGREGAQRAIENLAWLIGDRVIRLLLVFAVNVAIARHLGPDQFGVLSYVLAFVSLFAAFSTLGLDAILVRETIRHPDPGRAGALMGTAMTLRVISALIGYVAVSATGVLMHGTESLTAALVVLAASVLLFQALDVGEPWFQAKVASRYAISARVSALALGATVKIYFVIEQLPVAYFVGAQVFEAALGTLLLMRSYRNRAGTHHRWRFDSPLATSLIREGFPLFLASVAVAAYMRLDVILLAALASEDDVGYYSAAQRVVELWYFVPAAVCMSVFPSLVGLRSSDPALFFRRLSLLYRFTIFSSTAFALTIAILSPWLIPIVYGDLYERAVSVLTILAWASVAAAMGVASSQYLVIEGLIHVALARTLIGLSVAALLLAVLVPPLKSIGAAIAATAGYSAATFAVLLFPGMRQHSRCMLEAFNPLPLFAFLLGRKGGSSA
jgi:PST family polysaccharide transporter